MTKMVMREEPRMEKVRISTNFRLFIETWTLDAAWVLIVEMEAWVWAITKVAVAVISISCGGRGGKERKGESTHRGVGDAICALYGKIGTILCTDNRTLRTCLCDGYRARSRCLSGFCTAGGGYCVRICDR